MLNTRNVPYSGVTKIPRDRFRVYDLLRYCAYEGPRDPISFAKISIISQIL